MSQLVGIFDPLFWRSFHKNFKALYAVFGIIQPGLIQNILLGYLSAAQLNAVTDDIGLMATNDDHVKLRKEFSSPVNVQVLIQMQCRAES
jgi:hypothetical protein